MSDRILVTGSTGKVGKEVVNQLMAKGLSVRAADINVDWVESAAKAEGWKDVECVLFNYDQPETFGPVLDGVERMFIVPPLLSPTQHEQIIAFIKFAETTDVKHIVNLSQMGSDEIKDLPLRKGEIYIEGCGIHYTHLRPNWFNQNFNTLHMAGIMEKGEIAVPAEDIKSSYIDVRDIAAMGVAALVEGAKHFNKAYTLTSGKAIDHYEVVRLISAASGKDIKYNPVSEDQYRETLLATGMTEGAAEMALNLYRLMRNGGTTAVSIDVPDVLGREAISFEQYTKDFADSWK
jgi:uncharacterized protein YbjT (DUF2867 family)